MTAETKRRYLAGAVDQPEGEGRYRLSHREALEIIKTIGTTAERVAALSYLLKHVLKNEILSETLDRHIDELPEIDSPKVNPEVLDEVAKELERLLEPYKVVVVGTEEFVERIKSVKCVKTDKGTVYSLTIDTPLGPVFYTVKASQLYVRRKDGLEIRLPKDLVAELDIHGLSVNLDKPDLFIAVLAKTPCEVQDEDHISKLKKLFLEVFEADCKNLMERKSDVQTGGGDAAQGDAPEEVEEVGGEGERLTKEYPEVAIIDGEVHILKAHMAKYFVKYNIATKGAKSFVKVATRLGLLRRETTHVYRGKTSAYYVFDKAALDNFLDADTAGLCREKEPLLLDLDL